MIVAQTDRLTLRHIEAADAAQIHALLTDPDFLANIGHRGVDTLEDAYHAIETKYRAGYATHGFGMYALVTREGEWIGMAGLVKRDGLDDVDIGYALLPAGRGRGYALEACRAVLDHARAIGIRRVVAIVSPGNAASIAVLEKLGLAAAGPMRLPGADHDVILYVPNGGAIS